MEASLGALETVTKTASLLFNHLTPDERLLLMDEPVIQSGHASRFNENFSSVLSSQMLMLSYLGNVAPSEQGKLFVASGFLTLTQACWDVPSKDLGE